MTREDIIAATGLAFERVCLMHIAQIIKKLGISGVYTDINSWYVKADPERGINGSQIDLLIVRKDQVINLCEMKYSGTEYTITKKTAEDIRKKTGQDILPGFIVFGYVQIPHFAT